MELHLDITGKLPHGAISEISRKAEVSYPTALRTLKGRCSNKAVRQALIEYLKEYKEANSLVSEILG